MGATRRRAVPAHVEAVSAVSTAPAVAGAATAQLAAELVAVKATGQRVLAAQAILVAHDKGDPLNRIAADLGVHHSAVKRVLDAAEAQRQRHLLTAV